MKSTVEQKKLNELFGQRSCWLCNGLFGMNKDQKGPYLCRFGKTGFLIEKCFLELLE